MPISTKLSGAALATLVAVAPLTAGAVTVIEAGEQDSNPTNSTLEAGENVDLGDFDLSGDNLRIEAVAGGEEGGFFINTFVSNADDVNGNGRASVLFNDSDISFSTARWGGQEISFDDISTGKEAIFGTNFDGTGPGNGKTFDLTYDDANVGDQVSAQLNVSPVPLPAGGLLLLSAIGGVAAVRRRKASA